MTKNWAGYLRASWSRVRRSSRQRFCIPVVAAAAVVLSGASVAAAATTAAAAGAVWGRAVEVPGLAALNAGGNAQVLSVSCWRAGDCAAGGFYTRRAGYREAFVVTERNGRWAKAAEVPGSAALNVDGNAQVLSVSCVPGGYCAAGGFYTDHSKQTQGFVVIERNGRWGAAHEVPGLAAMSVPGEQSQVSSVSCAPGGYCAAGGFFDGVAVCPTCGGGPSGQGFVATERGGRWGNAQVPPGLAALNTDQDAGITTVSCPSAGNCAAGGFYQTDVVDADGGYPLQAFVVNHANGRWGTAEEVPGSAALNGGWDASVLSVSCSSAGNCSAGGYLQPVPDMGCDPPGARQPSYDCAGSFVVSEKNGRWGTAQYPKYPGMGQVSSVSCTSAGYCSAGGFHYMSACCAAVIQAYVITQSKGGWGRPLEVPGMTALGASQDYAQVTSVSCWSAGNCGAGGYYYNDISGHGQVFVASERGGRWGKAEDVPGAAALNLGHFGQVSSVSCTRLRNCVAGGFYTDKHGHIQAFVDGTK